jgi:hypothetical protein
VFDVELLEARRHIAALEIERAGANRAVNDLLVRSWYLEGKLAESADALALSDRRFLDHVHAEIRRVRAQNAALHARLHVLETSGWWRLEMFARRLLSALARRRRLR